MEHSSHREQTVRVSLIVPVYNMASEDRLRWCMDSLVGQTLAVREPGSLEVIAVDDASTDSSLEILRDYERRCPGTVRAIASPENRCQGGAKNLGLAAARGEWIGFIDADDWVTPDYCERLLAEAERIGADMVGCDYSLVYRHTMEPGDRVPNNEAGQTGRLDEGKYRSLLLDSGSLATKLYRRGIILPNAGAERTAAARHGSGTFPEGIFYEDNAVANTWMLRASCFAYLPEPLYYYYQHGSSTVHTLSWRHLSDRMEAGRLMLRAAREGGYLEAYRPEIEFLFTNLFYRNTLFSAMAVYRGDTDGPTALWRRQKIRSVTVQSRDLRSPGVACESVEDAARGAKEGIQPDSFEVAQSRDGLPRSEIGGRLECAERCAPGVTVQSMTEPLRGGEESIYRFTQALAEEMRRTFPEFQSNPYYQKRIDAEERGLMALQMRSHSLFFIKYRALWKYRQLRKKLRGILR